jgi:transposase
LIILTSLVLESGGREVIKVEDWAEIRRLHRAEGMSARAVARELGISRGAVLRALASNRPPQYRRAPKGSTVDVVEPAIRELLMLLAPGARCVPVPAGRTGDSKS